MPTSDVVMEESGREESQGQSQGHGGQKSEENFSGTRRRGKWVIQTPYNSCPDVLQSCHGLGAITFSILSFVKWTFLTAVSLFPFHNCVLDVCWGRDN